MVRLKGKLLLEKLVKTPVFEEKKIGNTRIIYYERYPDDLFFDTSHIRRDQMGLKGNHE